MQASTFRFPDMNYLYALMVALMVGAARGVEEGGPFDLTDDTFGQVINGNRVALVKFFSPRCGHCRDMEPAYRRLSEYFQGNSRVVIAQVNCDTQSSLCVRFQISGLPTLKFFPATSPNPDAQDANCGRDFDSMANFVESKLCIPMLTLLALNFLVGRKSVQETAADIFSEKKHSPVEMLKKAVQPKKVALTLTDQNFESMVLNSQKSVLVEFYAPCTPSPSMVCCDLLF